MPLHPTPEAHDADPPSKWIVSRAGTRSWHLDSSLPEGGTFGYYETRAAAEADKDSGPWVTMYEKEGRWFAGEPVSNWRPYADCLAERQRTETRWPRPPAAGE